MEMEIGGGHVPPPFSLVSLSSRDSVHHHSAAHTNPPHLNTSLPSLLPHRTHTPLPPPSPHDANLASAIPKLPTQRRAILNSHTHTPYSTRQQRSDRPQRPNSFPPVFLRQPTHHAAWTRSAVGPNGSGLGVCNFGPFLSFPFFPCLALTTRYSVLYLPYRCALTVTYPLPPHSQLSRMSATRGKM